MDNKDINDALELIKSNPLSVWITGLSGSGKTTIARLTTCMFSDYNIGLKVLDGDDLRKGINNNLGYSLVDRHENIRRAAEISKLFNEFGITTFNAFICPTNDLRQMAKKIVGEGRYFEIFLDIPLEVCESRDPKGLYSRYRKGEFKELSGIDSPFEKPVNPNLIIKTQKESPQQSANRTFESILGYICRNKR